MMYKIGHNDSSVNRHNNKALTSKQGRPAIFDYICNSPDYLMLSNWMPVNSGLERI
jgi:hypothetical protein